VRQILYEMLDEKDEYTHVTDVVDPFGFTALSFIHRPTGRKVYVYSNPPGQTLTYYIGPEARTKPLIQGRVHTPAKLFDDLDDLLSDSEEQG
jgi:hypothetical protein